MSNAVPRGTARALRRTSAAPSIPLTADRRPHDYDDDAVCVICGFDGAEWVHYRNTRHPDDRDGERAPECMR
jgi:hypothetical protein